MRLVVCVLAASLCGCQTKDHTAEDLVTQLRRSKSAELRARAAYDLGHLRKDFVPFDEVPDGAGPLLMTPAEQPIVDALNDAVAVDPDEDVRRAASNALRELRPSGRQAGLLRCVASGGWRSYECHCMETLLKFSTAELLEEPLAHLRDLRRSDVPGPRQPLTIAEQAADCAANAVREEISTVLAALDRLTRDRDPVLLAAVVQSLLNYKRPESAAILARALEHPDVEIRLAALLVLWSGNFESQRAAIEGLQSDPSQEVRARVSAMLRGDPFP